MNSLVGRVVKRPPQRTVVDVNQLLTATRWRRARL